MVPSHEPPSHETGTNEGSITSAKPFLHFCPSLCNSEVAKALEQNGTISDKPAFVKVPAFLRLGRRG